MTKKHQNRIKMLLLPPYFFPEQTASTHLDQDRYLAYKDAGISAEVYATTPTRGVDKKCRNKYKKIKNEKMFDGYVKVHRFSMFCEGKNPVFRAIRYVLVNIIQYSKGIRANNIDVIYSGSTPPTQGVLCGLVKRKLSRKYKKQIPYVYNLQDIFPDSLVNSGMTYKGSLLWKIGRKIENYTYRSADKIIVISEGFKRNIMAKGVPEEKIEVISNWIDLDAVHPVSRENNKLIGEFGINTNKFLVVYAGNFGAAQGADIILKAAEKLKHEMEIQFVIFGGGACFGDAKKMAENLDNIFIRELMPSNRISEVYSLGDVALITCKPGTGNAGMPSKMWSIMACNTPIIASFDTDSDLADVIRASGAGTCVNPGDVDALVKTIEAFYLDWKQEKQKSLNLREYVRLHASKELCVEKYVRTILDTVCK